MFTWSCEGIRPAQLPNFFDGMGSEVSWGILMLQELTKLKGVARSYVTARGHIVFSYRVPSIGNRWQLLSTSASLMPLITTASIIVGVQGQSLLHGWLQYSSYKHRYARGQSAVNDPRSERRKLVAHLIALSGTSTGSCAPL